MRYACLPLLAIIPAASGCSVMIASCGKDLGKLATREQVQQEFGKPAHDGISGGESFEVYRTRQKIAEPYLASCYGIGIAMTYGLVELFAFPHQLYLAGRRTIIGQNVRFTYNDRGIVTKILLDEEWHHPRPH